MTVYDDGAYAVPLTQRAGRLVQFSGAAMSVALIAGLAVWGTKLVMRDVSGVPVVAAIEGPMRVAPANPGGEIAPHAGLSVNAVAAEGEAGALGDTLVLAPDAGDLAAEDIELQPMAEADEVAASEPVAPTETVTPSVANADDAATPDGPMSADDVLALADRIASGVEPLTPMDGEVIAPVVALDGEAVTPPVLTANFAGPRGSLRPSIRPAAEADAVAAALASATNTSADTLPAPAVDTVAVPAGTSVIQLGAFPDPDVAAGEWTRLLGRHGDYLADKERLIMEASSGGRTFYRLRAMGFADLSEAQRICAALEAGGAACIPVVVR